MVTKFMVIISQYMHISRYYVVYLRLTYVSYNSIKLKTQEAIIAGVLFGMCGVPITKSPLCFSLRTHSDLTGSVEVLVFETSQSRGPFRLCCMEGKVGVEQ